MLKHGAALYDWSDLYVQYMYNCTQCKIAL